MAVQVFVEDPESILYFQPVLFIQLYLDHLRLINIFQEHVNIPLYDTLLEFSSFVHLLLSCL